jgi:hypothetical protein
MFKFSGIVFGCCIASQAAEPGALEYGKSLVEDVAKCGNCHTPRKANGEFDASMRLKGVTAGKDRKASPDLTSSGPLFANWGEQAMVQFLESGVDPKGGGADAHMPAYKLRAHDAKAIVVYLKSLK